MDVSHSHQTDDLAAAVGQSDPSPRTEERILIVEPEELVRWSLVTYLTRWFVVYSAASESTAHRVLDSDTMAAVILSDDLDKKAATEIESHARDRNLSVRLVRMVTDLPSEPDRDVERSCLEKPFQLSKLAELLGIRDASGGRERREPPCSSKTT